VSARSDLRVLDGHLFDWLSGELWAREVKDNRAALLKAAPAMHAELVELKRVLEDSVRVIAGPPAAALRMRLIRINDVLNLAEDR
jgi:hypothetical protein